LRWQDCELQAINRLPDDIDYRDAADEIAFLVAVREAERDIEQGRVISNEQMKARIGEWTEKSSSDIEAIVRYIAHRNPKAAARMGYGIYECAQIQHPEAGTVLDELRESGWRKLIFRRWKEQVGEIDRYSPDEPCPWCLGRISQKALAFEFMTDEEREQRANAAADAVGRGIDGEQYWGNAPQRELTVGYMTTRVGAMQTGYVEGWSTGASKMPHQRFQFDIGMPLLGVVPIQKSRRPECSCNRTKGWSDQGRADSSVTKPSHWN